MLHTLSVNAAPVLPGVFVFALGECVVLLVVAWQAVQQQVQIESVIVIGGVLMAACRVTLGGDGFAALSVATAHASFTSNSLSDRPASISAWSHFGRRPRPVQVWLVAGWR